MSPQDENAGNELLADDVPISTLNEGVSPQVTADGYDYWVLLLHFQEVVETPGTKQPQPGFFLAPGASCTFSTH